MSWFEEEFRDYDFDDFDSDIDVELDSGDKRKSIGVACKFCKAKGFHWSKHNGKWRLFDIDDNLHGCLSVYPKRIQEKAYCDNI